MNISLSWILDSKCNINKKYLCTINKNKNNSMNVCFAPACIKEKYSRMIVNSTLATIVAI